MDQQESRFLVIKKAIEELLHQQIVIGSSRSSYAEASYIDLMLTQLEEQQCQKLEEKIEVNENI